ncbi:hypothetical protein [Lachnoclostridium phytofermentans]|uniref:Uncharacterized protein n=1 Tax=Lachnoclostridium phytofermentans (strain ATCC 700394 / DSM 18823 / ISDg) TaxID=357809 RepID=A9KKC1_LACP7|nr:hypothetical protein [Lachnoclostridium phytofermentans]ABX44112.1 hypothetical protein Cphy_3765 [Lachnoclostridium phytofermentans ISDg]
MQPGLEEMIQNLMEVDDVTWGLYAFSRDQLKRCITEEEKIQMIQKAIACGKDYAHLILREVGSNDPHVIAKKFDLQVIQKSEEITGSHILFALYTPPNQIQIMNEPIHRAIQLINKEKSILIELFRQDSIISTILGHEIFHFLEQKYEKEIYTQTEKVVLWKLFGYRYYSTIRALSEIGAMAFTRELNGLCYSPFLLDVLLFYSYSSVNARKIYDDIIGISSGRCRLIVEDNS